MRRSAPLLVLTLVACSSATRGATSASAPVALPSNAPASFLRTTAEVRTTRVIDVREGLGRQSAMRLLTDALGQRFEMDVVAPQAGFALTKWQAATRDGLPDLRYRTRITARFLGEDWRRLQLHGEANWARGEEWDVGVDAPQLDSVVTELRAKLGRRP